MNLQFYILAVSLLWHIPHTTASSSSSKQSDYSSSLSSNSIPSVPTVYQLSTEPGSRALILDGRALSATDQTPPGSIRIETKERAVFYINITSVSRIDNIPLVDLQQRAHSSITDLLKISATGELRNAENITYTDIQMISGCKTGLVTLHQDGTCRLFDENGKELYQICTNVRRIRVFEPGLVDVSDTSGNRELFSLLHAQDTALKVRFMVKGKENREDCWHLDQSAIVKVLQVKNESPLIYICGHTQGDNSNEKRHRENCYNDFPKEVGGFFRMERELGHFVEGKVVKATMLRNTGLLAETRDQIAFHVTDTDAIEIYTIKPPLRERPDYCYYSYGYQLLTDLKNYTANDKNLEWVSFVSHDKAYSNRGNATIETRDKVIQFFANHTSVGTPTTWCSFADGKRQASVNPTTHMCTLYAVLQKETESRIASELHRHFGTLSLRKLIFLLAIKNGFLQRTNRISGQALSLYSWYNELPEIGRLLLQKQPYNVDIKFNICQSCTMHGVTKPRVAAYRCSNNLYVCEDCIQEEGREYCPICSCTDTLTALF